MALQIYNTMTRKKEEFVPLKRNFVQLYTCGLTVYDYMHIGHARTYLFWDVVRRYFTHRGYDVYAIINNTDIDDKNISRANELGVSYKLTGEFFTRAFYDDMRALGIRPYALDCTASDYIPEMIDTVKRIVTNGYGYEVDGDVFFSVEKFSGYGKLSGHRLEDLAAGSRVEVDGRKRHPADFALWKAAKPGEPSWESPWGAGRPGWHMECSSMAFHFFGGTYDIKGGAVDNMFPHHENEIAQTFAAYGTPLAKYYMHPEHFLVEGTKMSKSLGNFVTTRAMLKDWSPAELHLYFLGTHYRAQMNLTSDGLSASRAAWERFRQFRNVATDALKRAGAVELSVTDLAKAALDSPWSKLAQAAQNSFAAAMDDDFNTPRALAALQEFMTEAFKLGMDNLADAPGLAVALRRFEDMADVLGLDEPSSLTSAGLQGDNSIFAGLVESLIARRNKARADKDFAIADLIRDLLREGGVVIEDAVSGTRWMVE